MLGSTLLQTPASSSGVFVRPPVNSGRNRCTVVRCSRRYSAKPSLYETMVEEMPLVKRTMMKLSDYCTTLEGEECCSCWEAYFELEDLKKRWPDEEFKEFLQRRCDGMSSLIDGTHHAMFMEREEFRDRLERTESEVESSKKVEVQKIEVEPPRHIPDGIPMPKTKEEIEAEKRRIPDSYWTGVLRSMRIYPSWYREPPDVEYD